MCLLRYPGVEVTSDTMGFRKMPPKRSPFANGCSFRKGEENKDRFTGHASTELDEPRLLIRSNVVPAETLTATGLLLDPVLRPHPESSLPPPVPEPDPDEVTADSENWVVDDAKMLECFNGALKEHADHNQKVKGKNKGHVPVLEKLTDRHVGFGVIVRYKCKFQNCRFESRPYELFQRTETGEVSTNLLAGAAMAKSDMTPSKVEFFSTVMNIKAPAHRTLQKKYNRALDVADQLAETAMADNRERVYKSIIAKNEFVEGTVPEIEASTDAQYSNRCYHTPSGNSQSASIPVIESETGEGLLIQHASLSRNDGSLTTHINNAESEAAAINYTKTYQETKFPLALQTVTVDGDASIKKGFQEGVAACGDSRLFQTRACSQHGANAAKRKFMRESLRPLSNAQKNKLCPKGSSGGEEHPEPTSSNVCPKCRSTFKNARGVAVHSRNCQGMRTEVVVGGVGLEPMFLRWYLCGNAVNAAEKKVYRNRIRVWLFARMKQEFYKGLSELNPDKKKIQNDAEIKNKLAAAGRTVMKCIRGDHSACASDSFVCKGELDPSSYTSLPMGRPLHDVPSSVLQWLSSVVDLMLGLDALNSTVVHGRSGTTSLVESVHHEIRKIAPKGFPHRRNETLLIKSGVVPLLLFAEVSCDYRSFVFIDL